MCLFAINRWKGDKNKCSWTVKIGNHRTQTNQQASKRKVETDLYEYAPTDREIQAISYKKFSEILMAPFFMWLHLFEFGN